MRTRDPSCTVNNISKHSQQKVIDDNQLGHGTNTAGATRDSLGSIASD